MTTLNEDVNDTGNTVDDATNALLARWEDAGKLSNTDDGETSKKPRDDEEEDDADLDILEDEEGDEDNSETDDDEGSTDQSDDDANALEATDDHKVKITVDGEDKTVTVKELKRLFGQEASLTRKSQEVAAARKAAETDAERYMVAAQRLINKAEDRAKPFENVDWLVAQQRLTPDEFAALRSEAKTAYEELNFLRNEADSVIDQITVTKSQERAVAAQEAIKVLETEVPGWNREVYDKVRTYAVDNGMDPQIVSSIIDPYALKFIHKAMRFDELKAKATEKKQQAVKQKGAPKRVTRSSNSSPTKIGKTDNGADAMAALRRSGSSDDAVAALMARWGSDSDD